MSESPRRPSVASQIRVRRVYEVVCGICGENPDAEFYDTSREAGEARMAHVAEHEQQAAAPANPFALDAQYREYE